MSRLDDLVDLIQSANDVYLINPERNVRSAFIQIDDLCELTMKSWLQSETFARQRQCVTALETAGVVNTDAHRSRMRHFFSGTIDLSTLLAKLGITAGSSLEAALNAALAVHQPLTDWSANSAPGMFKNFDNLVMEVKGIRSTPVHQTLHDALDRIEERRGNRNDFFHDQNKSGLTVDGPSCLSAFIDLYRLNELLYGQEFIDRIKANAVVKAQIAVINLRLLSGTTSKVADPYHEVLKKSALRLTIYSPGHEYCLLHRDPSAMLQLLQAKFGNLRTKLNNKIIKIDSMPQPTAEHSQNRLLCEIDSALYHQIITDWLA